MGEAEYYMYLQSQLGSVKSKEAVNTICFSFDALEVLNLNVSSDTDFTVAGIIRWSNTSFLFKRSL